MENKNNVPPSPPPAVCSLCYDTPAPQMERGSASASFRPTQHVLGPPTKSECSLHVSDLRLDSCVSVPLSFANKTNLRLILSSSPSKISDNHSGPNWAWKNRGAGILIRTICGGGSRAS